MRFFIYIILFAFIFSDDLKNIQVLDITSNREMKKYMKSITKDLGAKCKSCHIMDDKSLDTPAKEIAREMILLTRRINEFLLTIENPAEEKISPVTCWTCHKGSFEVEHTRPEEE